MMEQQGEEPAALIAPPLAPPSHDSSSTRDWAALPHDVVLEILGRLRQADILGGAGLVCAEWRRAAVEEPTLWRHIDLSFARMADVSPEGRRVLLAMARAAVDRSAGQCEAFRCPADCDMLLYLADRAPSLRSLNTLTWCLPKEFSGRVITKLPMLERFEIELGGHVLKATLLELLEHCPRLEVLNTGEWCSTDAFLGFKIVRTFLGKLKFVSLPGYEDQCSCQMCSRQRREERRLAIGRGVVRRYLDL